MEHELVPFRILFRLACAVIGVSAAAGCSPGAPSVATETPVAPSPAHTAANGTPQSPASAATVIDSPGPQEPPEPDVERATERAAADSPIPSRPAAPVYRPSDARPQYDDQRAGELGIRRYESARLRLYTDIEPEIAATLPPLIDQAYAALERYFGPLPPDREGTPFQVTGYLMRERDRFRAAGMLPDAVDQLIHGKHLGAEFWMNDQTEPYYRRHLLIHEATHCYMLFVPGVRPPLWYLEGMAEFFGTHTVDEQGRAAFGVMPAERERFIGFGRIDLVREASDGGRFRSVAAISAFDATDFAGAKAETYAWSWAFCRFLDGHPRYRERFRALAAHINEQEFYRLLTESFADDMPMLWIEWELFARHLVFGFDIERGAIDFQIGTPLAQKQGAETSIRADAGWQPSGAWVEAGKTYAITGTGRVVLAETSRPWESEPQGISIRYAEGRPIGRLLGAVQSDEPADAAGNGRLETVIDIGPYRLLTPAVSGTLYLRVNDVWSELADNRGVYDVRIDVRTEQP